MKVLLIIPSFLLFASTLLSQIKQDSIQQVFIGNADNSLAELKFEEIDSIIFIKAKAEFYTKIKQDSSQIILKDSTFSIQTNQCKLIYNHDQYKDFDYTKRGFDYSYYSGFIAELDLIYLRHYYIGEFTLGEFSMLDKNTNTEYRIGSFYDDSIENPVVSPKNEFLAYYSSCLGCNETESSIGIIKINASAKNPADKYEDIAVSFYQDYEIIELLWLDNYTIGLKINKREFDKDSRKWLNNLSYLKSSITTL